MKRPPIAIGARFGRLAVVGAAANANGHRRWFCVCDCGANTTAYDSHLKAGNSKSCGCGKH